MWWSAAMLATILSYTWLLEPRLPRSFVALPGALVLGLGLWHALRGGEWGFAWSALLPALRAAALFSVPAVALLLAVGAARGTLQRERRVTLGSFALLVLWGGAQQWLLQTVVLRESQRATSRRAGVLVAAGLFAAVHLPNPLLTAVTFAGALAWCAIYDRHPNVIPLALSHALLTLAILFAFDDALAGRLRIGEAYLRLRR